MASVAALLSLCVGAIQPCPAAQGIECVVQVASGFNRARAVVVSPDDTRVAVGAHFSGLHVFDINTGATVKVPSYYEGVFDVAFSPDGAYVVVGTVNGAGVIDLATGKEVWFDVTYVYGKAVAFSPDGTRVATSHSYGAIYIRDVATGFLTATLTGGHRDGVFSLHFSPDGKKLLSGAADYDNTVLVWDVSTGKIIKTVVNNGNVYAVAVSADGRYFATATEAMSVVIRSLDDYSTVHDIKAANLMLGLSFSQDATYLVATQQDKTINLYSVASGDVVKSFTGDSTSTRAVAYLHNANRFVTASWTGAASSRLLLWDPDVTAAPAPTTGGPVQLVSASGIQDVAGVPVVGAEVSLPMANGMTLSGVPASLQGSSTAHGTRVAMGEKLRLSCASGSCGFVVAVYACKRCADAANDFEAQMVADGHTQLTCAPMFSVAGGSTSGQYVMRAYHIPVTSNDPVELEAVVHATQHVVAFPLDSAMGVSPPSCPPKHFSGPSPPCLCVTA